MPSFVAQTKVYPNQTEDKFKQNSLNLHCDRLWNFYLCISLDLFLDILQPNRYVLLSHGKYACQIRRTFFQQNTLQNNFLPSTHNLPGTKISLISSPILFCFNIHSTITINNEQNSTKNFKKEI